MNSVFDLLSLSIASIVPVFGWILLGSVLYRTIAVLQPLFSKGELLVFYFGIPGILFITATKIEVTEILSSTYALVGVLTTCLSLALAWYYARWRGFNLEQVGIIAQASYRSNLGIIGLALCASTFGEEGLILATLPVALWTLLFNILAVVVLNSAYGGRFAFLPILVALLKNPLIIGITLGFAVAVSGRTFNGTFYAFGSNFISVVIPLSLVFLGGAIDLRPSRQSQQAIVLATTLRLLIAPALSILICLLFGLRGIELAINFLLLGGPVAVASHIMVAAKGGDGRLAANIVVLTTIIAPFTLSLGLFLLRFFALV